MSAFTVGWLDVVVRSTGILISVLFASWILRRNSAATRHAVCVAGLFSLLVLPLATSVIPTWRVLPHWTASHGRYRHAVGDDRATSPRVDTLSPIEANEPGLSHTTELHHPGTSTEWTGAGSAIAPRARNDQQKQFETGPIKRATLAQKMVVEQTRQPASAQRFDPATALSIVLSAGSVLCGVRLLISLFWLRRTSRTASMMTGEVRDAFERCQRKIGLTRTVRCRLIADKTVPMVWGALRPEVLLPESISDWPDDRRNAVLLHELGHIARHDPLWQVVTELAGVIYWFHPMYWVVRWHTAALRERSCDDIVLNHGVSAVSYARALLEVISSTRRTGQPGPVAVAMAANSELAQRIRFVMDSALNRQPMRKLTAAIIVALCVLMVVPLAVLHAADQPPPRTTEMESRARLQPAKEADLDLTKMTNKQLLARFERAPFGSATLMTGSGFVLDISVGEACRYAAIWETQQQLTMEQDSTVREMIRRGDAILPGIHDRITKGRLSSTIDDPIGTWGTADLYGAYAYVAGQIGNRETVNILIQLLRRCQTPRQDLFSTSKEGVSILHGMSSHNTVAVITHALWQLTGRRHAFSADEWEQYLEIFGDEFVPARERSDRVPDPAAVEQHVRRLTSDVRKPSKELVDSREWLLAQGPAIVPQLLRVLKDVTNNNDADIDVIQMAWVIDELGATERLPLGLRKIYFKLRLSHISESMRDALAPLEDLARRRALEHLPFSDFVEIALNAEERLPDALRVSMNGWLSFQAIHRLQVKFGAVNVPEVDLTTPNSPWAGVTPLKDPAAEIEAAILVLVGAITSPNQRRQKLGIKIAEMLSLFSKSKPAALIEALRKCWTENHDSEAGRIMAQFRTPTGTQAVLDGLQSNDLTILTQAVSYLDEIRLKPATHFDVFLKLLEYTLHPVPSLRRNAVVSLKRCAPEMLYTELERLSHDTDQRIREECVSVLSRHPTRLLVDVLFDIANNRNEEPFLRKNAVSALGDPEYADHIDRMLLFFEDKELKGLACSAIADAAGSDALAVFYGVLQSGHDGDGNIYQYLERLTGAKPEQTVEAWQKWFAAHPDKIPAAFK